MPATPVITSEDLTTCCGQWAYAPDGAPWHLGLPNDPFYFDDALDRALIVQQNIDAGIDHYGSPVLPEWGEEWAERLYGSIDEDEPLSYPGEPPDSVIQNYSYKPPWRFHGDDSKVYLGAEMEMEAGNALYDGARDMQRALGDLGLIKEDGSLDYGMEVVTHPMTYQWSLQNFPWEALNDLSERGFFANSDCGIHVHVNRSAFDSASHVYRWLALVYRNPEPIQALAGRGSVDYSNWNDRTRRNLKKHCKGDRNEERYVPINVQNPETYEVRMFAGSVDPSDVQAALAFVDASVEYTRQLTAHVITAENGWSFTAFCQWVVDQGRWTPLEVQIASRVNGQANAPQSVRPRETGVRVGSRVRAVRRIAFYIPRDDVGTVERIDDYYPESMYVRFPDDSRWVDLGRDVQPV